MTSSKEIKYFLDGVEVSKQNWDAYGCSDMTVTDFGEFFSIECKNKLKKLSSLKEKYESLAELKELTHSRHFGQHLDLLYEFWFCDDYDRCLELITEADKRQNFQEDNISREHPIKPLENTYGGKPYETTAEFNLYNTTSLSADSAEKEYLKNFNLAQERFLEQKLKDDKTKGVKNNSNKLPMSILFKQFPRALQAVVLASCYGHNKYKKTDSDFQNFRRVGGEKTYLDAHLRHQLDKEIYGEKDLESGLHHLFHEAFNKLAEVELYLEENKIDIKEYAKEYLKNL